MSENAVEAAVEEAAVGVEAVEEESDETLQAYCTDLEADMDRLKKDAESLQYDLRELRAELDRRGAPPGDVLHTRLSALMNTEVLRTEQAVSAAIKLAEGRPTRRRLPDERKSFTHKFTIFSAKELSPGVLTPVSVSGFIITGEYPDGRIGEIFVRMDKEHAEVAALLDQFSIAISLLLQVGYPLDLLIKKFRYTKFEPAGRTSNEKVPVALSPVDYLFAYISSRYPAQAGVEPEVPTVPVAPGVLPK